MGWCSECCDSRQQVHVLSTQILVVGCSGTDGRLAHVHAPLTQGVCGGAFERLQGACSLWLASFWGDTGVTRISVLLWCYRMSLGFA